MTSSLSLTADGFQFDFHNVTDAYVFDEKDPSSPHFHGGFMKAADIVAEFDDCILFIELKDYRGRQEQFTQENGTSGENEAFKWLKNYLKYKFRDTYLYRYAETGVPEKDIHYVCLLSSISHPARMKIKKDLMKELPVGQKGRRWTKMLAKSCQIVDVDGWNRTLSEYASVKVL